jgi:hypothetical protein
VLRVRRRGTAPRRRAEGGGEAEEMKSGSRLARSGHYHVPVYRGGTCDKYDRW